MKKAGAVGGPARVMALVVPPLRCALSLKQLRKRDQLNP